MELRKYWEILCRRKWVFIITLSIIFATSMIGTFFMPNVYEAKSKIFIDSTDTLSTLMGSIGLGKGGSSNSSSGAPTTYDTDIALATIQPILGKLISGLNLKDRDGTAIKTNKLLNYSIISMAFPRPYIEIEQYKESELLEITSISADPEEAANMSNKLAELYINERVEYLRKEYTVAREFIEQKINDVKENYYNSLLEKKMFMMQEETLDLNEETSNLIKYIFTLKNEQDANEIEIAQDSNKIRMIEEKIGGREYASIQLMNSIETKLSDLLVEVSGISIDITEEHPDIMKLNKQIDTIRNYLSRRAEIVLNEEKVSFAPIYEDLLKDLKDAYINGKTGEIKRNLLKQHLDKAKDKLMEIPAKSMRKTDIELSLSVNQDIYKDLLNYRTNVGIVESMSLSNIKLVEPAVKPEKPDSPSIALNCFLGIFMGTFWGIFLVFLLEYIDNTIKGYDDLSDYKFTFLGSIPKFKAEPLVSKTDTNDPVYEAYHRVLSNIHFATQNKPIKRLLIGSVEPKSGSSTTASNLGILYAREGKKVLLIDADLRRPNLHRTFNCSNTLGISDLLLNNAQMDEVLLDTEIGGLTLLPTGTMPEDAGMLVKSEAMGRIIKDLENRFDMLLFHSAPLLIKNDAILLMKNLDGMVLVLGKGSSHNALQKVQEHLTAAKIDPIGVILNSAQ